MKREARQLSVPIDRSAAEAYEFLSVPENLSKWASGLAEALRDGPASVRFSERNAYGVLDHAVDTLRGSVYIPLRVVPKGSACELVLTLFRQPRISDEKFAADAEWVMRDLHAAKRILESAGPERPA